jgi:hypothetical protein
MRLVGLRRIISFSSFKNSVVRDILDYYSNDNIVREVNTFQAYHNYPIEMFYIGCLLITVGLLVSFEKDAKAKKMQKLEKIQDKDMTRCINVFIIIFTMIFTKNIENAI